MMGGLNAGECRGIQAEEIILVVKKKIEEKMKKEEIEKQLIRENVQKVTNYFKDLPNISFD